MLRTMQRPRCALNFPDLLSDEAILALQSQPVEKLSRDMAAKARERVRPKTSRLVHSSALWSSCCVLHTLTAMYITLLHFADDFGC